MADTLQKELETFHKVLPTLTSEEGKFALVINSELVGVFDSYADALKAGYEKAGLKQFLVKRISQAENISYFTRDFESQCRT